MARLRRTAENHRAADVRTQGWCPASRAQVCAQVAVSGLGTLVGRKLRPAWAEWQHTAARLPALHAHLLRRRAGQQAPHGQVSQVA